MDLSHMRFKNSKFYGPTVTSVSPMVVPYLKELLSIYEFETGATPHPYLFAQASDVTRCMASSAWSQYAKAIFKKWTGVACPPKTLRHALRRLARPRLSLTPPAVRTGPPSSPT